MNILTDKPRYHYGEYVEVEGFDQPLMVVEFALIERPFLARERGYNTIDATGDVQLVEERKIVRIVQEQIPYKVIGHD